MPPRPRSSRPRSRASWTCVHAYVVLLPLAAVHILLLLHPQTTQYASATTWRSGLEPTRHTGTRSHTSLPSELPAGIFGIADNIQHVHAKLPQPGPAEWQAYEQHEEASLVESWRRVQRNADDRSSVHGSPTLQPPWTWSNSERPRRAQPPQLSKRKLSEHKNPFNESGLPASLLLAHKTCTDTLADNHGASGNCSYSCQSLEGHYFPTSASRRGALRCFVYNTTADAWPNELLSQARQRRDDKVLLPTTTFAQQSTKTLAKLMAFTLQTSHHWNGDKAANKCIDVLVRVNVAPHTRPLRWTVTRINQSVWDFQSNVDFIAGNSTRVQEYTQCLFAGNYSLRMTRGRGSMLSGTVEVVALGVTPGHTFPVLSSL